MRKETLCIVCHRPIYDGQRPSVQTPEGDELHAECFNEWRRSTSAPESARRPPAKDTSKHRAA